VNGVDIKQSDLALADEDVGADMQNTSPEAKREHLISYLSDIIMVTQAAEKKNLGDNPDFKRRLAFLRNKLLMGFGLQEEAKSAITDEALHQTYDEAVKSQGGQEEVRARHILVEGKDKAREIFEKIAHGSDFAQLAKQHSRDPGSKDQGGELGFFKRGQMVPQFEDAAFKLKKGEVSEPFESQFGWHVVRVDDRRQRAAPPFEAVKDRVVATMIHQKAQQIAADLRGKAQIEYIDPEIKRSIESERPGARPKQ
jgi:peptidyl-prolyl cis-trans isomerase C